MKRQSIYFFSYTINSFKKFINSKYKDDNVNITELLEELNSSEDDYTENIKIELPNIPNEKINILKDEEKEKNEDEALEMLEKMMI